MKLYFAPMEGITNYVYRKVHNEIFGGCDAYYSPFITPSDNERLSRKGLRDIHPELNEGINLIPQVLVNRSETFFKFESKLKELGYSSVNINMGCPAQTVVKKNRGSAMLKNLEDTGRFLDEIFAESKTEISVKSRIGFNEEEAEKIISLFNCYPFEQVIIHPRIRSEFYKGKASIEAFSKIYELCNGKLCYNGDVFTLEDFNDITKKFPLVYGVMIGRGAIKNPAVFREIRGGNKLSKEEIILFTERLSEEYMKVLESDAFTLHKLKEIWEYLGLNFVNNKKLSKGIKKATVLSELLTVIRGELK